ncbi:VOC family protein [Bacillus norwichensis]|uniref:VOC family protein n=1 Tax=Bacillus norwichensis TaxID=2762217 RepID=A0ABR8VJ21_9BACI|nr:VOC family protein [Bacillus norwichensis]MBD8004763.1 VOC family protein [Bacillus norwichensis]
MAVDVYLMFNGNCREAVEFYAEAFQTEVPHIMTFGEAPSNPDYPVPEEVKDRIIHAHLNIEGSNVMFSDTFPGNEVENGNNITLAYVSKNMDDVKSVFHKLSQGGTVDMELQETFFSKSYGKVTDKFGIGWQLSHTE